MDGFESDGVFGDAFARIFGPPPADDSGSRIAVTWLETPLGPLVAGARDDGICLLEYTDRHKLQVQVETVQRRFEASAVRGDSPHFTQLRAELTDYFAGRLQQFTVPLVAPGTPFQERVWAELLRIPYGETRSYEELARIAGAPGAQRAVGHANGLNRIAIVIPCHRVVNKNGKLGGYGGLLWRKQALLDLERRGQLSLLTGEDVG